MPQLHSAKTLPSVGTPGDVYFHAVDRTVHIALGDGRLYDLAGLLSAQPVGVVGKQGEPGQSIIGPPGPKGDSIIGPAGPQGPAGQSIKGDAGANGLPGRAGHDGRDAVGIQGPQGIPGDKGERGPRGEKGEPGTVTFVGDADMQAAVAKYKAKHLAVQAALLTEIAKAQGLTPLVRAHVLATLKRIQDEA